jgi:NADH:ubiquinone oxidoreductase subunit C
MVTSLVRRADALSNDELVAWLRKRVGDGIVEVVDLYDTLTVTLTGAVWNESVRLLKEEPRLAFTMFDSLFGVDAREDGFDVQAILYSVETGARIVLKTRCAGGREAPTCPTLIDVFVGAMFHERETWDMYGIVFDGNNQLAPRLLCDENFEGWPLRKDFHLATREAKPWPGVKEPAALDEDGNIIVKEVGIGEAVGPMALDEVMAAQARAANPDQLQDDAEAVEAEALAAKAAALEAAAQEAADVPGIRDADDVRAEAAQARADKAAKIAVTGPVGGESTDADVPQGNPDAFKDASDQKGNES